MFFISPVVKRLLIVNLGIWIVCQIILERFASIPVTTYFSLSPSKIFYSGEIWRFFTYQFLHSMQISHILFNSLMLYFSGVALEKHFGSKKFLLFYLGSGVGAGVVYAVVTALLAAISGKGWLLEVPVVGASGAIYGLLLAQGILFSENIVYVFGAFPMKMKYFVMGLAGVEFLSWISSGPAGSEVAYVAHLGGLAAGFLGLKIMQWMKKPPTGRGGGSGGSGGGSRSTKLKLVVNNAISRDPSKYWE